ncbi:serine/threonine protein kinase [Cryobacterium frigoriphilum]|uniref:non-specific serine/threonine protein kinase n=1 Tax=Cryobacterium frigoriphilum TaxID=1259150 RepID=A0A4R8ZYP4_9MICO|nr:serine/threonine-protein kinase [Cryobacterium frigoriphilum]TFD48888.1 serine/threonine protein kinase [Cryobacterium frigoriphilum]
MTRRLPSPPPNLPGFSYVRVLGSGGFADVFLYEQNLPRRPVAVKVLLAGIVTDQVRQMFRAEADLMALLSSHPSILTVFQSSVSSDGRPYLVMEYCSASLSQRYRAAPLAVPDVLRIGIKIASAVETAHRAGVLHRDIKPSNILVTAYGHPVLSDFGIASTLNEAEKADAVGLSIPWSAPEVLLDEVSGTIASEVWSLGATLYSLLAGRSPFEVPGSENSTADLMGRIVRAKVPPIGRADVPARLDALLTRSMSRNPQARQRSVLELVRELQTVEADLGLAQTPLEVALEDWAAAATADPDDKTRITGVASIDPAPARRRRSASARPALTRAAAVGPSGRLPLAEPLSGHRYPSVHGTAGSRSALGSSATVLSRPRRRVGLLWVLVAASVVLVGGTAAGAAVLLQSTDAAIPRVTNVDGSERNGRVLFEWTDPGTQQGDSYVVALRSGETSIQRGTAFTVDPHGAASVCVTVTVNRAGKYGEPSREKCVDVAGDAAGPVAGDIHGDDR